MIRSSADSLDLRSGVWNHAERNYDATKRECRCLLKTLQELRFQFSGLHFVLETVANVLVAQLNRAATDLPGVCLCYMSLI
jgi:hypothetical protein